MAEDPSTHLLLEAAHQQSLSEASWLDSIIAAELTNAQHNAQEWRTTSCLLQDIGNFLARTTTILSKVADHVVNGEEIHRYAAGRVREMDDETDMSELDPLDYLQSKHTSLK